MSRHNCKIKIEIDSEFSKRLIETMQKSRDCYLLEILCEVMDDLLKEGKISKNIWFEATSAWARAREILDDREI